MRLPRSPSFLSLQRVRDACSNHRSLFPPRASPTLLPALLPIWAVLDQHDWYIVYWILYARKTYTAPMVVFGEFGQHIHEGEKGGSPPEVSDITSNHEEKHD